MAPDPWIRRIGRLWACRCSTWILGEGGVHREVSVPMRVRGDTAPPADDLSQSLRHTASFSRFLVIG